LFVLEEQSRRCRHRLRGESSVEVYLFFVLFETSVVFGIRKHEKRSEEEEDVVVVFENNVLDR
jgi:hypothetical protein